MFVLLAACQNPASDSNNKVGQDLDGKDGLVSQEIFQTPLGAGEVYGVRLHFTSDKNEIKNYAVRLAQNEKVWFDTLQVELSKNDTLESEIIFSEAIFKEDELTQLSVELIANE